MVNVANMLFSVTVFLLIEQCRFHSGLVINPSKTVDSLIRKEFRPQPPDEIPADPHGIPEQEQPILLLTLGDDVKCALEGDLQPPDEEVLNVTVSHHLFRTELLVTGITYQGKSQTKLCNFKKICFCNKYL